MIGDWKYMGGGSDPALPPVRLRPSVDEISRDRQTTRNIVDVDEEWSENAIVNDVGRSIKPEVVMLFMPPKVVAIAVL